MGVIDIVFAAVFIFSGFMGYKKGFVAQFASLAGLLLGIWGAIHFSDVTATFLREQFDLTTEYLPLIAFAVTFTLIVVAVHFLGLLVEGVFNMAFLGVANSLLGVAFGVLKTAFILSVVIVIINKADTKFKVIPEHITENSIFYSPLSKLAPAVFPYLNFDEIQATLKETFTPNKE